MPKKQTKDDPLPNTKNQLSLHSLRVTLLCLKFNV